MAVPRVERRLAAILAADVVGYGRLMRANEEGTLAALQAHRRDLIDPLLTDHRGRIVKLMGDGALVEFSSVSDAVRCAVAIQRGMAERMADMPADQRITFRIGINIGDVIVDDQDIHGDGVNLASRLEALSPPGAVAVSAAVREQVGDHFEYNFVDLGVRTVKQGDRPLRIYLVDHPPGGAELSTIAASPSARPSIAVLPFENLSRDPDQDYFGEGIAEDLITDLSKISGLQVAGRRTTFAARQTTRDALEASARLQVGHVLEGSVRRAGNRVRITARLVDGSTGAQVWGERYDRTLDDIFAVQDDITHQIVAALQVKLLPTEKAALARPTTNVEAYGDYLRGLELLRPSRKAVLHGARRMFVRAVDLDPTFARALAGIAECDCLIYMILGGRLSFDEVLAVTERALQLEPDLAGAHASRGVALLATDRAEEAERSFQHAIADEPDHAMAHFFYGRVCVLLGRSRRPYGYSAEPPTWLRTMSAFSSPL